MNKKTRRAQPKFNDFHYKDYTVGISHAGRAAIESEITNLDLRYRQARGDTHDGECTAADLVLELATKTCRLYGMPRFPSAFLDVRLNSGVPLTVHIDQQDRLLSCWVASEADNGKVPGVHIDDRYCSGDFLAKYCHRDHTLH